MKVAIDTSAAYSDHSVRGIGTYTKNLVSQLKSDNFGIDIDFFNGPKNLPKADLVHFPYFDLFFQTLPIFKKTKTVVTIHDVIPLVLPSHFPVGVKGRLNLFFQKRALSRADVVICDSQTSKNDIAIKLSYPKEKIHVVYLAPAEIFKPITKSVQDKVYKKLALPIEFILYVGDVNWNKNLENLVKAVKIDKVKLVMVGQALVNSELPEVQKLNQLIKELQVENDVIKTGYISDVDLVSVYNLAKLTVLASHYEGFGLPVLESMACGTPVVCSRVSSLSEITGDAAIYCNPQDPEDIAGKIQSVLKLKDPELQKLKEKSLKNAAKYNWEKVAKETVEIYKSLR